MNTEHILERYEWQTNEFDESEIERYHLDARELNHIRRRESTARTPSRRWREHDRDN